MASTEHKHSLLTMDSSLQIEKLRGRKGILIKFIFILNKLRPPNKERDMLSGYSMYHDVSL